MNLNSLLEINNLEQQSMRSVSSEFPIPTIHGETQKKQSLDDLTTELGTTATPNIPEDARINYKVESANTYTPNVSPNQNINSPHAWQGLLEQETAQFN